MNLKDFSVGRLRHKHSDHSSGLPLETESAQSLSSVCVAVYCNYELFYKLKQFALQIPLLRTMCLFTQFLKIA